MLLFLLPLVTAGHHDVLHVPHVVHDLHRQAARPARLRARPRVAVADDGAADRPGGVQRRAWPGAGQSWDAEASFLAEQHPPRRSRRRCYADFGHVESDQLWKGGRCRTRATATGSSPHDNHDAGRQPGRWASWCWASSSPLLLYYYRVLDPAEAKEQFPRVHAFLMHKWYFDELYSALLVRPALVVAHWCRWFDLTVIDGIIHCVARAAVLRGEVGRPVRQRHRRRAGERGRRT